MRIVIPTRGRVTEQHTLKQLPPELRAKVTLVCPDNEVQRHTVRQEGLHIVAQPDATMTISAKRKWIIQQQWEEKILMLDDDLRFQVRREDRPDRLREADHQDIKHWFTELENLLSPKLPLAGFGARAGNDKYAHLVWHTPWRIMFSIGIYVPIFLKEVEMGRIETREDMDYALQLLRKGYSNTVCHAFVADQIKGYQAAGGCTGERTLERSNSDAELLASLHPGLVRVVKKEYKNHPRLEVVCSWKKALERGEKLKCE